MQTLEIPIVFGLFFFYFLIYKFVFLNSVLDLSIRKYHSKSYIKKNKTNNYIKKIFYANYKNELPKFYYYQNIVIVLIAILCLIMSIVSIIVSVNVIKILFLIMISVFYISLLNWELESTFSRIKSKSIIIKILISLIYSVLTFFIIFQIIKTWIISTNCFIA